MVQDGFTSPPKLSPRIYALTHPPPPLNAPPPATQLPAEELNTHPS